MNKSAYLLISITTPYIRVSLVRLSQNKHHFVPIHTCTVLFLVGVCVLGQFSVQYTLSFLQCNCNLSGMKNLGGKSLLIKIIGYNVMLTDYTVVTDHQDVKDVLA